MLSRRRFLRDTTAGLACVSLSGAVPGLFARAADTAARTGRTDRALVVVELTGGNDGLNTIIPYEDDHYHQLRPTLRVAKEQVLRLTDQVGLHPTMAPAGELFKEGKLAIVQGVGYPQPDRSHFRSMEIWHTASTATRVPTTGWLGRVLDQHAADDGQHLRGLALTARLPQALQADRVVVPLLQQLDALGAEGEESGRQAMERRLSTTPAGGGGPLGFLRRQAETAYRTTDQLRQAAARHRGGVQYPEDALGQQLFRAAQVLTADLGTRLVFLAHGGMAYDTHSEQAVNHPVLLTELAAALAAFQRDLENHRVADKVVVLVFSEFGRRVRENASGGTDHGAASCLFLVGSRLKGGLAGTYPSLEALDDGDLAHTVDFRSVYATLLEQWLGCPAEPLLGAHFPPLDLLSP